MAEPVNIVPIKRALRAPRAEDWQPIFNLIAENHSMVSVCEEMQLHKATVEYRIAEDEDLTRLYMLARARRADALAEKAIETAQDVLDGTVEVARARVALPVFQWAAAQLDPKKWGQSTTKTEITGKDGRELQAGQNVVIFQLPDNDRK